MPDTETRASEVFSYPASATDSLTPTLSQLNVSIISGYSETSELLSTDFSNADRHFPLVHALSTEFYPIRDSISRSLDLGSIFALTRVCKSLRGLYRDLKRTHWSIDNHLSHFFANAKSFRNMMRACGAVVSGSSALQFFDRVYWRESDLDVYFDGSVSADPVQRMGKYLVDVEGYVFVPNRELGQVARWEDACGKLDPFTMTEIYANRHIRAVFTFARGEFGGPTKQVQLILCCSSPLLCIINFHSTLIMNFYTWNRGCAMFPLLTFIRRRGIKTRSTNEATEKCYSKYSRRGYTLAYRAGRNSPVFGADVEAQKSATPNDPFKTRRYLNDRYCWMIEFDTTGISPATSIDTISDFSSFALYGEPCTHVIVTGRSPRLKFLTYYAHDIKVPHFFERSYVYDREWAKYLKMRLHAGLLGLPVPPSSWSYHDLKNWTRKALLSYSHRVFVGRYLDEYDQGNDQSFDEGLLETMATDELCNNQGMSWDDEIREWWKSFKVLVDTRNAQDKAGESGTVLKGKEKQILRRDEAAARHGLG